LLAARLDALDPGVRRMVADAAVLGTTFPAEALIAVSGQDEPAVRSALDDLVRREVLSVSADRLSPERGSYGFAQQMLRQVAYDTLSRRDRKARHLKVAAHLRSVFPGDGEEVADVVARHYLDALNAVPDDADVAEVRGQAIGALIRAAERAERSGAPARAVASYAAAADLTPIGQDDASDEHPSPGVLWERAARAADNHADWNLAFELASRARDYYARAGQARAAARAQAVAGMSLMGRGSFAEAQEQLTTALAALTASPDTDTVTALWNLARLQVNSGSPEGDRLSAEALSLGQALDVGDRELSGLFRTRGLYFALTNRRREAVAYCRESVRLAEKVADNECLGVALLSLGDALGAIDPAAAAEAARASAGHLRRTGTRYYLAVAYVNLSQALEMLGDWDGADAVLTQAADSDGLGDYEFFACSQAWLAALRGDTDTARKILDGLPEMRASEDPQSLALVSMVEGFTAAAGNRPHDTLRHARAAVAHADTIGISHDCVRWAWPLAARAAHDLDDTAAAGDLLALLDPYQPGHLTPLLRVERELTRARLAARAGDPDATAAFAAAITALRELGSPYHLAYGLLDHAEFLARRHDTEAAGAATAEAADIAERLRCQPLLDRGHWGDGPRTGRGIPAAADRGGAAPSGLGLG
jgi:tetratricopeptide (TPR) repeat protein